MSVQQQIDRIEAAKEAIATAITGKGVTVPSGTKLDGMAGLIDDIEAGGGSGGGFPNGTEWTLGEAPEFGYNKVTYGDGLWVAGSHTENKHGLWYSSDGKTWTQSNITSNAYSVIVRANGLWVSTNSSYNPGLLYSSDGKTWTQSNETSGRFNSVANANGIWVAGGYNIGLLYSFDGKTWTQSNVTSGVFNSVANANGIWVAAKQKTGGLYYSVSWEPA